MKDKVDIVENASYETLLNYLKTCAIGMHCMSNEHFGICVVEYMAAGLITLAHDSAGPKMDIVKHGTGFLADCKATYAARISEIVSMTNQEELEMRIRAREHVCLKFSERVFTDSFLNLMKLVITD